jgi:hypothetical protein
MPSVADVTAQTATARRARQAARRPSVTVGVSPSRYWNVQWATAALKKVPRLDVSAILTKMATYRRRVFVNNSATSPYWRATPVAIAKPLSTNRRLHRGKTARRGFARKTSRLPFAMESTRPYLSAVSPQMVFDQSGFNRAARSEPTRICVQPIAASDRRARHVARSERTP